MIVLRTRRLTLRWLTGDDAPFILELLNEPSFIRHIADKHVRTVAQAEAYIRDGPGLSYVSNGFGLYLVEITADRVPIGICGLVRRDTLEDVDVGFAFLPAYWSRGYAVESAAAVMDYARNALGIDRVVAITNPDNHASIRLLERIGLRFEQMVQMPGQPEPICLYVPATTPE